MESLLKKLNSLQELSKECDSQFNELEDTIKKKQAINQEEDNYLLMRDRYKKYISSYSKEYVEMSEVYVGPELTREIYQKLFKPTYLDSKEDIQALYKIFIFYMLLESTMGHLIK